jgi:hypothetical protein
VPAIPSTNSTATPPAGTSRACGGAYADERINSDFAKSGLVQQDLYQVTPAAARAR